MSRATMRADLARVRRALRAAWAAVPLAELAQAAAIVGGWALFTWGVASLTVWQAWPLSAGLALLSASGWRFLARLGRDGLYTLSRRDRS